MRIWQFAKAFAQKEAFLWSFFTNQHQYCMEYSLDDHSQGGGLKMELDNLWCATLSGECWGERFYIGGNVTPLTTACHCLVILLFRNYWLPPLHQRNLERKQCWMSSSVSYSSDVWNWNLGWSHVGEVAALMGPALKMSKGLIRKSKFTWELPN